MRRLSGGQAERQTAPHSTFMVSLQSSKLQSQHASKTAVYRKLEAYRAPRKQLILTTVDTTH